MAFDDYHQHHNSEKDAIHTVTAGDFLLKNKSFSIAYFEDDVVHFIWPV